MKNRPQIICATTGYEMSDWCVEKSGNTLRSIARIHDRIKAAGKDDIFEKILSDLSYAAHNVTVLFSFLTNSKFQDSHVDAITQCGVAGFEEVAFHYGALEETENQKILRDCQAFADAIIPLLNGNRSNRILVNRVLSQTTVLPDKARARLENLTDDVNLGEISWDAYCVEVRRWVDLLVEVRKTDAIVRIEESEDLDSVKEG